jgi:hypothetical protein
MYSGIFCPEDQAAKKPELKDAAWCRAHDHKDAACINQPQQRTPEQPAPVTQNDAFKFVDSINPNLPASVRSAFADLTAQMEPSGADTDFGKAIAAGDLQKAKELFPAFRAAQEQAASAQQPLAPADTAGNWPKWLFDNPPDRRR